MSQRFQAILFDVDGTLLDSAADICGAVDSVLSKHLPTPPSFEYLKTFIGRHLRDLWIEVLPDRTEDFYDALLQDYRTTYWAREHKATKPYPYVAEALALVPGRKSTATTKSTQTAANILTQFGLRDYFEHIQGTDGFPAKPEPDVIWRALEALSVKPEDCLMVGDSVPDMIAAKRAGLATCAVRYGYGHPDELAAQQPDFLIDDLRELPLLVTR